MEQQLMSLRGRLHEINELSDDYWTTFLNDRKKTELQFHDKYRDRSVIENIDQDTYEKIYGNKKYYSATILSKEYMNKWIKYEAKDRIFRDYYCGDGKQTIEAAKAGAKLTIGIDLSSKSIKNARQNDRESYANRLGKISHTLLEGY